MASHQSGRNRLNLNSDHRIALIRNQASILIEHGHLKTTKAKIKIVQQFVERLVTIARKGGSQNIFRLLSSRLPYKTSLIRKLLYDIAPKYIGRPGGYTRVINLGSRLSDTAKIARIEWV